MSEYTQDTFAPVVAWSSIRIFLVLTLILGWTSCSIDFSLAFVHAWLKEPVWIHLPRGFKSKHPYKTCLKLKRSLYGTSFAPKLWFAETEKSLKEEGFKQSSFDKCFYLKEDMMIIQFVDDHGISAKNPDDIDKLITNL